MIYSNSTLPTLNNIPPISTPPSHVLSLPYITLVCSWDFDIFLPQTYVTGNQCDSCQAGYYHLSADNPDGCLPCWCSGVSSQCFSSNNYRMQLPMQLLSDHGFTFSNRLVHLLHLSLSLMPSFLCNIIIPLTLLISSYSQFSSVINPLSLIQLNIPGCIFLLLCSCSLQISPSPPPLPVLTNSIIYSFYFP